MLGGDIASSGSKLERGLSLAELESLLVKVSQCKGARSSKVITSGNSTGVAGTVQLCEE